MINVSFLGIPDNSTVTWPTYNIYPANCYRLVDFEFFLDSALQNKVTDTRITVNWTNSEIKYDSSFGYSSSLYMRPKFNPVAAYSWPVSTLSFQLTSTACTKDYYANLVQPEVFVVPYAKNSFN